jgi:hypothetical protein
MIVPLFSVQFKAKQIGEGTIKFTKSVLIGGSSGSSPIPSELCQDKSVNIVPVDTYDPNHETEDPLQELPKNINNPRVIPKSTAKSTSSSSATAKTVAKTENSAFKIPALSKLEFNQNAILDKANSKSQGAVFTGTAEPNSKVYLLIHSQAEIYTDAMSGADGSWTKTIDSWLEDGGHTISVWSERDNKISPKLNSKFVISSYAKDQIAIGDTYPVFEAIDSSQKTKKESKLNTLMKNNFFWAYIGVGMVLAVTIVVLIIRKRKKGKIETPDEPSAPVNPGGGYTISDLMPSSTPQVPEPEVPVQQSSLPQPPASPTAMPSNQNQTIQASTDQIQQGNDKIKRP